MSGYRDSGQTSLLYSGRACSMLDVPPSPALRARRAAQTLEIHSVPGGMNAKDRNDCDRGNGTVRCRRGRPGVQHLHGVGREGVAEQGRHRSQAQAHHDQLRLSGRRDEQQSPVGHHRLRDRVRQADQVAPSFFKGSKVCTVAQAGYSSGQPPKCPATAKAGAGIINNLAGNSTDPSSKIPCNLGLTLFVGDGKTSSCRGERRHRGQERPRARHQARQRQRLGALAVDAALPAAS